ncbi:hypothetical protein J2755_000064 [Methanohalophilus levihalophilus]|uniref:DUF424 domain-containing protein n=1 Tax=Methanohalophilus levihalophilus TaxID=1431282 RepID=UPI001AE48E52|nr:DUF424 family protein [Methanohalophilus levihalophilus]MBP2029144.1 hypothetical protein [Methanohalophilus levihalophilus]
MYLKIHKQGDGMVLAACDQKLIGSKLKKGKICVEVTESFYKGDIVSEEKLMEELKCCVNANLFGEKVINCAIKCGMVDPDTVMIIDGVPHVQIYRV